MDTEKNWLTLWGAVDKIMRTRSASIGEAQKELAAACADGVRARSWVLGGVQILLPPAFWTTSVSFWIEDKRDSVIIGETTYDSVEINGDDLDHWLGQQRPPSERARTIAAAKTSATLLFSIATQINEEIRPQVTEGSRPWTRAALETRAKEIATSRGVSISGRDASTIAAVLLPDERRKTGNR